MEKPLKMETNNEFKFYYSEIKHNKYLVIEPTEIGYGTEKSFIRIYYGEIAENNKNSLKSGLYLSNFKEIFSFSDDIYIEK